MPVNSYSQPEVGFVIGALAGFVWIWRTGPHGGGRGQGTGMYLFMLICGAIGYGIQLALELSAGTACVQTRGLALPMGEMTLPVLGALAGFFGALIVCVRNLAFDSVAAGGRMLFLMFGCGGIGMGAGLFLQSIAAEICRHWH
jgi:hypothetical protein